MKIAYLLNSVSRKAGGLFESVRGLARSVADNRTAVTVFGLADEYAQADAKEWWPLKVELFDSEFGRWGYSRRLRDALGNSNVDVLSTHGLWKYCSVVSKSWGRQTGRPYLVHPEGMLDPWAVNNARWKKRAAALLYEDAHLRGASCLRALSHSEAESIRAFGLRNPICVIPNGMGLPDETVRRPAPWADGAVDRKVLLYLGRLHPKKNLLALLDAWAAVRRDIKSVSEWVLVIAGWDESRYEAMLRNKARDPLFEDSVVFVGALFGEEKSAAYANSAAFILPSLSEGLPMVVLEAWAYAKPVLMTPECNLPEGFAASASVRIGTTVDGIASGVRQLFGMSDTERAGIGSRGRALVAERFSWPRIGEQMRAVYRWVLGGGAPPETVRLN